MANLRDYFVKAATIVMKSASENVGYAGTGVRQFRFQVDDNGEKKEYIALEQNKSDAKRNPGAELARQGHEIVQIVRPEAPAGQRNVGFVDLTAGVFSPYNTPTEPVDISKMDVEVPSNFKTVHSNDPNAQLNTREMPQNRPESADQNSGKAA